MSVLPSQSSQWREDLDAQKAVRTSRKVQKTPHGHHVQTLVDVDVEEEGVGEDVDADVVTPLVGLRRALLVSCLCLRRWRWRGEWSLNCWELLFMINFQETKKISTTSPTINTLFQYKMCTSSCLWSTFQCNGVGGFQTWIGPISSSMPEPKWLRCVNLTLPPSLPDSDVFL